jgi:hypothetical protein
MATSETEIVEGELVPYEQQPGPITLFNTSDPRVALERMSDLAKVLVDLVRSQKLAVRIRGGEHLRVEAWRALGGMIGIYPITAWSRPNESGDGYLVRVEARTRAGEIVGASEAECTRAEQLWSTRDAHAVRAMAETRATSRALRGPLGQIVVLAGYNPTAAEEMPTDEPPPKPQTSPVAPVGAEPEQVAEIIRLIGRLTELRPGTDWKARAREITGGPPELMTVSIANVLIRQLQGSVEAAEQFGPGGE